jgi:NADH dehydrogenase FAD-containing subunit
MIPYDTLVIAVGSFGNDFGTPGVKEYAIQLDTPPQAKRFHSRLVNALFRAHAQHEPLAEHQLQVAIIGAGATGVELAADIPGLPARVEPGMQVISRPPFLDSGLHGSRGLVDKLWREVGTIRPT